jgi:hypothetical protein
VGCGYSVLRYLCSRGSLLYLHCVLLAWAVWEEETRGEVQSDCLDDSGFRKVCDKSSEGPSCDAGLANRRPNVTGAPR